MAKCLDSIFPGHVLVSEANDFFQEFFPFLEEEPLAFFIQGTALLKHIYHLIADHFAAEQMKYHLVGIGPEILDDIEDQGGFTVLIGMHKPNVGVQAGDDAGFFYQGIKDPIVVI